MWIFDIIGIIACAVWLFAAIATEKAGSAAVASLMLALSAGLLAIDVKRKFNPDKINVKIIETKTPPTIDTLIRHGAVSDTTYVITAIDAKIQ